MFRSMFALQVVRSTCLPYCTLFRMISAMSHNAQVDRVSILVYIAFCWRRVRVDCSIMYESYGARCTDLGPLLPGST